MTTVVAQPTTAAKIFCLVTKEGDLLESVFTGQHYCDELSDADRHIIVAKVLDARDREILQQQIDRELLLQAGVYKENFFSRYYLVACYPFSEQRLDLLRVELMYLGLFDSKPTRD